MMMMPGVCNDGDMQVKTGHLLLVDRVSISPLINPPILRRRRIHTRVTVGTLRAYLIQLRRHLRISTPLLRERSSRRELWDSRKIRWIRSRGKQRGNMCRVRVFLVFCIVRSDTTTPVPPSHLTRQGRGVGWARGLFSYPHWFTP